MKRAIRAHLGDFVSLLLLFLLAIGVSTFIIAHQDARPRIPLIDPKAYTLKAEFSTAQAVTPGQGQSVRAAGVEVGKIKAVELKNGVAVVTMELDPEFKQKLDVRSDATALLRPRTGLKDMFVELDPGGTGQKLGEGATIPVQNTSPDVNPDEVLSSLDSDTRQYLKLLINGAGRGLENRGNDLNQTIKALEPTNRDLQRVSAAIASRRVELKSLIHNYGDLTNTLGDKDRQIRTLVNASDAVFRAFAAQRQNIAAAISKLPPTLRQTQTTLIKANAFAKVLRPALDSLNPAFRQLNTTNKQILPFMREAFPETKNQIRPFVQVARPYVRNLRPAAINLSRATPDLTASFYELNRLFNELSYNANGKVPVTGNAAQDGKRNQGYLFWLAWLTQNGVSLFSTSDAQGPIRRILASASCTTINQLASANPLAGPLLGITNALRDPGLCPSEGGGQGALPTIPGLPNVNGLIPLKRGRLSKQSAHKGGLSKQNSRKGGRALAKGPGASSTAGGPR